MTDAFVGTWKLNVAKSRFAKGHEIKELSLVIARDAENVTVTVNGIDGAGKTISIKYSVPDAGGTLNYTEGAPPEGTTVVSKRIDDHTVDQTSTVNGKEVASVHSVLSATGRTLTQTRTDLDENGKYSKSVVVYDRQ